MKFKETVELQEEFNPRLSRVLKLRKKYNTWTFIYNFSTELQEFIKDEKIFSFPEDYGFPISAKHEANLSDTNKDFGMLVRTALNNFIDLLLMNSESTGKLNMEAFDILAGKCGQFRNYPELEPYYQYIHKLLTNIVNEVEGNPISTQPEMNSIATPEPLQTANEEEIIEYKSIKDFYFAGDINIKDIVAVEISDGTTIQGALFSFGINSLGINVDGEIVFLSDRQVKSIRLVERVNNFSKRKKLIEA